MSQEKLAYHKILVDHLAIKEGEGVLVVTDPGMRAIAERMTEAARSLGAEAVLVEMSERANHGSEPPAHVAAAMAASDVIVALTSKSMSHAEARRYACDRGARAASMPTVTEEMLARTMRADPEGVRSRSRAVAEVLSAGRGVRVTSSEGTDVTFVIEGRSAMADDGDLSRAGSVGNLPAGEGFIAPVEGRTNGRVVFDGATPALGAPLVVVIEDGYAVSFEGEVGERFRSRLRDRGRDALAVAELGVGTNDAAILTGNILEDEKILGTVHIAFGDNHSFGGTVRVSSHEDLLVMHPEVTVDGELLLSDGRLRV